MPLAILTVSAIDALIAAWVGHTFFFQDRSFSFNLAVLGLPFGLVSFVMLRVVAGRIKELKRRAKSPGGGPFEP